MIHKRPRKPSDEETRRDSIRNFCIQCMGGDVFEVKKCTAPSCWLYPYRMGAKL